jgi:hypothetical protein
MISSSPGVGSPFWLKARFWGSKERGRGMREELGILSVRPATAAAADFVYRAKKEALGPYIEEDWGGKRRCRGNSTSRSSFPRVPRS